MSWIRQNPHRRFSVEILIDGLVVQTAYADRFSSTVSPPIGDGCYGFAIPVAAACLDNASVAEARLANLGDPIGAPIDLADPGIGADATTVASSRLGWLGGLRFRGWIAEAERSTTLKVVVNGEEVMELDNLPWAQAGTRRAISISSVRGLLDFHLPGSVLPTAA